MSDMAPILLYYAFKTTTPFVDALVNERLRQLLPSTPLTIACLRRCLECVLHAARWKYRTQKIVTKSPSGRHRTLLSGYIFATEARIDNRKNIVKQQYLLHMFW